MVLSMKIFDMVLSDLSKRNETEGNLMVWFNFGAGLVVLIFDNFKTHGLICQNKKRNWWKFDGVVYFWSWLSCDDA